MSIELPLHLNLAQITFQCMCEQERTGICFDSESAEKLVQELTSKMEAIEKEVEPQLPSRSPLKSELSKMTPPKLQFKKDGTPSANCIKWFDEVYDDPLGEGHWFAKKGDVEVRLPHHEPIIQDMKMTLGNQAQLKDYLLSLGWKPEFWNFKTEKKKGGKPQKVRDDRGRYIKTTPKLQENGKICPNLELLGENAKIVKPVLEWLTFRHRRSQIQGWLNNPRLEVDGRLGAGSSGLTNTKRQKHTTVVNVPRVGSVLGAEMRSLFTVPEGKVLVGYDASSLEDRVKAHYLYKIDGGEMARKVESGTYDPHTESAVVWELPRSKAKNGNYALQYLCQPPTLAKTLGCTLQEAEEYHRLYWELNSSLGEFVQQVKRAWIRNDKKFVRTIDHSKIFTRYEHSIANAVMQSTGAKIMDCANAIMRKEVRDRRIDAKRVLYMHDEAQWECTPEDADLIGKLGCDSIRRAGEFFKMNCPMDAEYAISNTWEGTH